MKAASRGAWKLQVSGFQLQSQLAKNAVRTGNCLQAAIDPGSKRSAQIESWTASGMSFEDQEQQFLDGLERH